MNRTTTSRDARSTPDPAARDVAMRLLAEGVSNRETARRVGVTETTVRRWRKQVAPDAPPDLRNDAPSDAHPSHDDAPATHPEPPAAQTPATRDDAPRDVLVLDLDPDLRDDLAVLAEAGLTAQQAVALAVHFVAFGVNDAWDHQVCPRGILPTMRIQSRPPQPYPADTTGTDQLR